MGEAASTPRSRKPAGRFRERPDSPIFPARTHACAEIRALLDKLERGDETPRRRLGEEGWTGDDHGLQHQRPVPWPAVPRPDRGQRTRKPAYHQPRVSRRNDHRVEEELLSGSHRFGRARHQGPRADRAPTQDDVEKPDRRRVRRVDRRAPRRRQRGRTASGGAREPRERRSGPSAHRATAGRRNRTVSSVRRSRSWARRAACARALRRGSSSDP